MTIIENGQARAAVVVDAMGWVGTPYHPRARIKRVGVDCAHLLIAVYCACGHSPDIDPGEYPTDWHLHRSEELYRAWLQRAGAWQVDTPLPGDIGLFRFGRTYSHGAISAGADLWVHAYIGRGVIVSRSDEDPLHARDAQYWRIIGSRP